MIGRSRVELTQTGWVIFLAAMALVMIGLACIYVTNTHYIQGHDGPRNALKQLVRIMVGMAIGLGLLRVGYYSLGRLSYPIFLGALLMLLPLFVADVLDTEFGGLTPVRNGAQRWIQLPGFLLQPSEFMKVAFVLALAWYLRYRRDYRSFAGLLLPLIGAALPLLLILLEPDLGTCILMAVVLFSMLFAAGARIRHILTIFAIGLCCAVPAWNRLQLYQRERILSVLLQSQHVRSEVLRRLDTLPLTKNERGRWQQKVREWHARSGYQLVHSKNAIGSGGLLGYGWGEGMYVKSTLLPDRHNDFVFAIIGHQWGLLGSLAVLFLYALITLCGVLIASSTTEPFARLLAVGVTSLLTAQVLVNVGMTLGLLPITGMTLPFVSYGGSSLLTNFISIALLISVARHRPFLLAEKPFEFGQRPRKTRHVTEPGGKAYVVP